jgi:hypothetical protein
MAVTPPLPHLVADGRRRSWQLVGLWHGGTSRPGLTRGLSRPEGRQPVTAHVTSIRYIHLHLLLQGIKIQGVAQFQRTFDPDLIQVCDVLLVDLPMDLGFTVGLGLSVTISLFSSPSCSRRRGKVRESVGFKSGTCVDDSMGAAQIRAFCPFLCLAP